MPQPIVCQDERLRQYLQSFSALFSRPQYEHFVTVLMGLLVGKEGYTLSHLKDAIAGGKSLSSLSRFLAISPWDHQLVAKYNFSRFCREMQPKIERERQSRQEKPPKKRGKRVPPLVTGYLIGDDSTMSKAKGVKMQDVGKHYSTTYGKPVQGHSFVQCLYSILDRSCPLEPQIYRQEEVAKKEGVLFTSKIDLMIQQIKNFNPPSGTATHVLLDSWYNAKNIWKTALSRDFHITTGIKRNRFLRVSGDDGRTPLRYCWRIGP
jgi:hypothetical protein